MSDLNKCEIIKVGTIEIVKVPNPGDKLQDLLQQGIRLDGWIFGRWADMRGTGHEDVAWDLWDEEEDCPAICGWTIAELMAAEKNPSEFTR
jgi:hypothetical protein